MAKVSDKAVIVGCGETKVGRLPGATPVQIQARAVLTALENCNLTVRDVDGLINLDPYVTPSNMFSLNLGGYLGLKTRFSTTVDVGGTCSGMMMLQQAVWAIEAGHCETVVCVYGENGLSARPTGSHGFYLRAEMGGEEWEEPFGLQGMVTPYALLMSRYIYETGVTETDFGSVAVVQRRHAILNGNAMMLKPMTMEDYLRSRLICSPIRLFDCSAVVDGGGAIVVTSAERARRLGTVPVKIRSLGMRFTHNTSMFPDIGSFGMAEAGRDAFESAGMEPDDIDVAEIHDAFTLSVLYTLDTLGFCKPGEAGQLFKSGAAALGGKCPINTHGGLLSQGHIGGMLHLVEAVRQLQGNGAARQVENAKRALVAGNGGIFAMSAAMILERG